MSKQDLYNWLVKNKGRGILLTMKAHGIQFNIKVNGFDVNFDGDDALVLSFINNSGSAMLPLSKDCIIEEVNGGYRVADANAIFTIQLL